MNLSVRDWPGVLALDMAQKTGWAVWTPDAFVAGVLDLGLKRGHTNGARFQRLESFVLDIIHQHRIGLVAYEQTLTRHTSGAQAALANGLVATLERLVESPYPARAARRMRQRNLDLTCVNNMALKFWAHGTGDHSKKAMLVAAKERWKEAGGDAYDSLIGRRRVVDDNMIDAVWVLNWALHHYRAQFAPWALQEPTEPAKERTCLTYSPAELSGQTCLFEEETGE